MSRAPELATINCTACGAGLDVLGGGRVTRHICSYCGTELDATDNYRALKKFANQARPETPFRIGMTGTVVGVDWTIVGVLQHRENWAGKTWEWIDHQLYSPTHGYAWLTLEDGHVTFARRMRGLPHSAWMSERWVETAENVPTVSIHGQRFRYLQTSTSTVSFAEGEFTWSPTSGEKTVSISALAGDSMIDFAETGTEREIHQVTWLDPAQTCVAFGLEPKAIRPKGVHPAQPYRGWKEKPFLRNVSGLAAVAALVIGLVLSFLPGTPVLEPVTTGFSQLPRTISFEITDPARRLAGIYFSSNVSNSWAYVEVELTDPQDETLFEAGRTIEYYFGRDSEGNWSEGGRYASLHFLPTVPGTYELTLTGVEQGVWGNQSRNATYVEVTAKQGMSSGTYLFLLALVFALLAALLSAGRMIHHTRRWRHSDWSDD